LLTMKIRHGFPGRNSYRRYGDTKAGFGEDLPLGASGSSDTPCGA
jgi:hypothetical protein